MKREYTKQEYNLPDPSVGISEMQEYGYTWEGMLPLTKEKAIELFERDLIVYRLYNDGSETIVDDIEEITVYDGLFGVEKRDWVLSEFRTKTNKMFHNIDELTPTDIEEVIMEHVQEKIDEYDINATIITAVVTGSRCRGMENETSDLDVVVELSTKEKEDYLFNIFKEDEFFIDLNKKIKVDINPITVHETGKLENYLPQVENYLMMPVKAGRSR